MQRQKTIIAAAIALAVMSFKNTQAPIWAQDVATTLPAQAAPSPAAETSMLIDEIDLREAPLRDALTLIGGSAGVNLAASDEASKTKVTIHLRNVTPYAAVQAICQTHGLFFNKKPSEEGIDIVTTVKEFQEGLTVFREEKTAVYTLLYPNAVDLAAAIRDLFGSRVRLSLGANGATDTDQIQRGLEKFDLIDSRSDQLSLGLTGSGGGSGSGGGNNSGGNNNSSHSTSSSASSGGGSGLNLTTDYSSDNTAARQ